MIMIRNQGPLAVHVAARHGLLLLPRPWIRLHRLLKLKVRALSKSNRARKRKSNLLNLWILLRPSRSAGPNGTREVLEIVSSVLLQFLLRTNAKNNLAKLIPLMTELG